MAKVSNQIFTMVKNFLHITYTVDSSTQARLENEISSGIEYIHKYVDPGAVCSPGTHYGDLLCEYVLRKEAGAGETFAKDFSDEITGGKISTDVDAYAEAMGYSDA